MLPDRSWMTPRPPVTRRGAISTGSRPNCSRPNCSLSYTDIRAPIAGRIGRSLISVGNFVSPSSGTLATIVSQDPIDVIFPISQREILELREESGSAGKAEDLAVYLQFGKGNRYSHTRQGSTSWTCRSMPAPTRSNVRASFPNPERLLVDGQLVTAVVETDKPQPIAGGAAGRHPDRPDRHLRAGRQLREQDRGAAGGARSP